jgi:flagellar biosynthesis/type III secretory pathway protein FliH
LSPEAERRIAPGAEPCAARLVQGTLEDALEAHVVARERRARAAGRAEGLAAARAGAVGALDAAALRLDQAREAALGDVVHQSVDLALEIARTLLRCELPAGRYDLEAMVREALSFSGVERGRCVVHLHPEDAARLANVTFRAGTAVESDPGVPRGSVHVTTPQGLLVRDLDEALRAIGERLHAEAHA